MKIEFKAKLFDIPILGRRLFRPYIVKKENGDKESVTLRYYVKTHHKVTVGMYSYGGCFSSEFNLGGSVEIGRYCSFAANVHYFGANHPMDSASMSPYFYHPSFNKNAHDIPRESLQVGHDVWCGYGVIITNKCKNIGNGAVIAAGTIVTKDVPPYAIVSGVPAKVQRYRFDKKTIALLEQSKWWELTPDELLKYNDYIKNPSVFAHKIMSREPNILNDINRNKNRIDNASLLRDNRFYIDEMIYRRVIEGKRIVSYDFTDIELGKLLMNLNGKLHFLKEVPAYKYLKDREVYQKEYDHYCMIDCNNVSFRNRNEYNKLIDSMNFYDYDPHLGVIIIDQKNNILDGQHRSCILMYKYGMNYKVPVLKIHFANQQILKRLVHKLVIKWVNILQVLKITELLHRNTLLIKYNAMPLPVKAGMWFIICSTLQKCIGLITTPIFTRLMSANEYGLYSIYISWINVFSILTTFKLDSSVFSKGMSTYKNNRDGYIATMQIITSLFTFAFFLIYICFRTNINNFTDLSTVILLLMIAELFVRPAYTFWILRERYEYSYIKLAFVIFFSTIVNSIAGVIAVVSVPDGSKGFARIISCISVQVCIGLVLYFTNFRYGIKKVNREYAHFSIKFNLPLIPHYISTFILNQIDRIMIQKMIGIAEAGLYSIAYNIAMAMEMISSNIANALTPWYYKKLEEEQFEDIRKIFLPIMILACIPVFIFIAFAPELMRIMVAASYYEAIYIIPPVSVSVLFILMYGFFSIPEFYFNANKFSMYVSMVGAVLNIGLNYIFLQIFGYYAAAYTTMVCYMIFAFSHYIYASYVIKKEKKVRLFQTRIILVLIAIDTLYAVVMNILYTNFTIRYTIIGIILIIVLCRYKQILKAVSVLQFK